MHLTTNALVLREVAYKESDKILTLLSKDMGKITVSASGCRKKGSQLSAGCQQLVWAEFVLYQRKGRWSVKEVSIERLFSHLPQDFLRFSLACYFAEVGELLSMEGVPQDDLLSLLLNCLFALDMRQDLTLEMVKSVFELRVACQAGYEPMTGSCFYCHEVNPQAPQFSLQDGIVFCQKCGGKSFSLSPSTLSALRYIVNAPPKKIFHFALDQMKPLSLLAEGYLLSQLDYPFPTLEFYRKNAEKI
ncbi:MAG: DNA repair protein RecO [Eubacteriales bacterium]